jgi:hypothetical protein
MIATSTRQAPPTMIHAGPISARRSDGVCSLNASPPDTFVLLSNNPGVPHKGGTCFGDSGGPTFANTNSNLVVAVTSFGQGQNLNCSGVGGGYRLDQPDDLAFLRSFGITP